MSDWCEMKERYDKMAFSADLAASERYNKQRRWIALASVFCLVTALLVLFAYRGSL